MKKLIFVPVVVLAGLALFTAPKIVAQDSDQITIKDQAEFNAYQNATTQTDPKAQASALEGFLSAYPQSVVKKAVLNQLLDAYQQANDPEHELSAADRLLQVEPNDMKAIFISVSIKKIQCGKTNDAQVCEDLGVLAKKGLSAPKPASLKDDEWKKLTTATYPAFHSALALSYAIGKKDFKSAIEEYRQELLLYPLAATTSGPALVDTLQLAEAYAKPDARDMLQAAWFYARAWNFAPASFKAQIETKLEYWYKRYHGNLEGIDALKTAAAATLFKPEDFVVKPAPTPAELAHQALTGADPAKLNLEDKEFILANGSKEDADQLWSHLKGQMTPVPGIVIEASATVIKLAVTQDAKDNKVADFIVNLKKPLEEKEIPAVGFEYKLQPATELDATYDTFTAVPAAGGRLAAAQIVLNEGFVQSEKKAPAAKKPAPGRRSGRK